MDQKALHSHYGMQKFKNVAVDMIIVNYIFIKDFSWQLQLLK